MIKRLSAKIHKLAASEVLKMKQLDKIDNFLANLLYCGFFYDIIIVGVEGFHTRIVLFIKIFYILEDF